MKTYWVKVQRVETNTVEFGVQAESEEAAIAAAESIADSGEEDLDWDYEGGEDDVVDYAETNAPPDYIATDGKGGYREANVEQKPTLTVLGE